jgi:tetratricopeptide (TPR) repeat protein
VSLVIICGFGLLFIILNTNKERDKKNSLNTLTSYLSNAETDPSILQKCVTIARNLIEDYPDEIEIIEVYGDILRKNGQISDAADQYSKAIGIDNKNQPIWNKLLYCLLKTKSHDELLSKSMKAIELFPEIAIFYYYNGKALIHKNRHDLAVKTLQKGSTLLDKDASLNVEFYWLLAESYQELKDNESSDLYYEKALIIDPKNPNILNSYSYRLSVRKVNLERAAKMAKLSIEIDPGKPENQDTYGWILYMQGEYNESKKWIEMALNSGGYEIGTILEHYGDVLYRLNDSIGALEYWKKAKVAGNTTEFIDKKIENKTLYE